MLFRLVRALSRRCPDLHVLEVRSSFFIVISTDLISRRRQDLCREANRMKALGAEVISGQREHFFELSPYKQGWFYEPEDRGPRTVA